MDEKHWRHFLHTSDGWLLYYFARPRRLTIYAGATVDHYMLGHAAELHLKAAYGKITGDMDRAIEFGHDLNKLLRACKSKDPSFPSDEVYISRRNDPQRWQYGEGTIYEMVQREWRYEWDLVTSALVDWKYPHNASRTGRLPKGSYRFASGDDLWLQWFWEMRQWFAYPSAEDPDVFRAALAADDRDRVEQIFGLEHALDPNSRESFLAMRDGPETVRTYYWSSPRPATQEGA